MNIHEFILHCLNTHTRLHTTLFLENILFQSCSLIRCCCTQTQLLVCGAPCALTRQRIYSQQLLTVSVTSLHPGSFQSHRSNDLALSVYFCAAIIGSSFQLRPLSLCRTCFAAACASADAFSSSVSSAFGCLWSSQQVIIWSCKKNQENS